MSNSSFSHDQIVQNARFSREDLAEISRRRRKNNRLGFAYQLAFVRLAHRFPTEAPFEIVVELLSFVSMQLNMPVDVIEAYKGRRQTIAEHHTAITLYLGLNRFGDMSTEPLEQYLFQEASRIEQTGPLLMQAKRFLREANILFPADDTLRRLIITQRQAARAHIYKRISNGIPPDLKQRLDDLLVAGERSRTPFFVLKQPPGRPTPKAMLRLAEKLKVIQSTGVHAVDLEWLNNNYQRSLTRYAARCSADRLRNLQPPRRYAVLVCFLRQTYRNTIDYMIDMHHKLMTAVYTRAQEDIDRQAKKQRRKIRSALSSFHLLGRLLLDNEVNDVQLRDAVFGKIDRKTLADQVESVEIWLTGKYSHVFNLVVQRFSYLRQFAPSLINGLDFHPENNSDSSLIAAVVLLQEMNVSGKRKLPDDPPLSFIPKKLRALVTNNGEVSRRAWESALLTAVRDEIRAGNIYVDHSQRFGRFDDFFMTESEWEKQRESFFERAGLPVDAADVPAYLNERLDATYDHFLTGLPSNSYASLDEDGWQLSTDPTEKLDKVGKEQLANLETWLSEHLRDIKLPELLIEVDNELQFSQHFMIPEQQRHPDEICPILATIMAHGCNVGPYTMAQLTQNVSYRQIKRITDWQMTEESQRQALAQVVNAISRLDVTQAWGAGKTSSSDGQRFRFKQKVLQQTWSNRFNDYALEFYSFVADNYAPFYSTVIECTDRDAAYVLDGLLYNESDLTLEEHYTDTHGYTEINFAAFAMLGRPFSPRIRGIQKQRIYRIDTDRNYGALAPLLKRKDHIIHLDWICKQWDRMGHFYASLERGHVTASTALKRLVGYSGKNHFYRANRELGRVFKTEHILRVMSDPLMRQQMRRGLLKSEEMHALARQVAYGKQGTITARDWQAQKNTASCLTLIMACIIYWQAKEISRVILEQDPETAGVDLSMLEHISPIGWENILLYGEYVLDPSLVMA